MKKRVLLLALPIIACAPSFYQAPPPLEKYPARTAGRDWRELLDASLPPLENTSTAAGTLAQLSTLTEGFTALPRERRIELVAKYLGQNRDGEFSARSATLLQELSELAGEDALLDGNGAQNYLDWRLQSLTRPQAGLPPLRTWRTPTDESYQLALDEHAGKVKEDLAWLEQGRGATPPGLMPNFEIQSAALLMKDGRFDEALEGFRNVIESAPDHPRAEVARFMIGRCYLAEARAATRAKKGGEPALRREATKAFQVYLQRHPQGRLVPDAHGWLGAVAADEKRYGDAVRHQLDRLASRSTRETRYSVMRECDSLFVALCDDPRVESKAKAEELARSLPWRAIARSPEIARLFVCQALDPAARNKLPLYEDNESGDHATVDFLNERILPSRYFAKRGLSLLAGAMLREGDSDPLTLTVLGWSSLRAGEEKQALGIFDKALSKGRSDELLQGRAAALNATGQYSQAAEAYDELLANYPDSPLAASADFDAAIATYKAGEAGEAVLRLRHLSDGFDRENPKPTVHPEFEDEQWCDAIAHLAPIEQLAAPLKHLLPEGADATLLRGIIRYRAIAEHRFDLARRHLDPPLAEEGKDEGEAEAERYHFKSWQEKFAMDQARWDREIEPMAAAYAKLAEKPKDPALQLEIGRLWKSRRGQLSMPLHELFDFSNDMPDQIDSLRRSNGVFLGFGPKKVAAMLDSHDELHHALGHFLAAAESSRDPVVAAAALEEANEALLRLCEFSPYRATRAIEEKHSALSARLVARLKKDFPGTPQAARAVTWVFPSPAPDLPEEDYYLERPWMPGGARHWNVDEALLEAVSGRDPKEPQPEWSEEDMAAFRALPERIKTLGWEDKRDVAALKSDLASMRADFDRLRKNLEGYSILQYVDDLDDFASVIEAPGISPNLFRRYVNMRLEHAPPPPAEGEWQPLKPWLAFYDRIRPITNGDYYGPNNSSIESWAAYLQEFPDGPKSEAASLRLIRGKIKLACPRARAVEFEFPEAPVPGGYSRISLEPPPDPGAVPGLLNELAAHELRFPNGRYQADILLLRAKLAAAQGEIVPALEGFTAILSDPAHPELRLDAALYLSYFSLQLLEPDRRLAGADAFRSCPAALPFLRNLVTRDTCLYRLRPLLPWLEARSLPKNSRDSRSSTP